MENRGETGFGIAPWKVNNSHGYQRAGSGTQPAGNDGSIEEGIAIDQSAFAHLAVFEQIAKRNAQAVFMQMESE